MKKLRDKFAYWKKRMVFRLKKLWKEMDEWCERNPFFAYVIEKFTDLCWFTLKAFIVMEIVFLVLFGT